MGGDYMCHSKLDGTTLLAFFKARRISWWFPSLPALIRPRVLHSVEFPATISRLSLRYRLGACRYSSLDGALDPSAPAGKVYRQAYGNTVECIKRCGAWLFVSNMVIINMRGVS